MEVILRLLHGQDLNASFSKPRSHQRHGPLAGVELWLLIRGTLGTLESAQGWGWPRAAAAGLLSACRIQIAAGGLPCLLPGLVLFSLSAFPLSNHLSRGLSLNFRGLRPLTALKLGDAGGAKMFLLLLVWQGKSSEIGQIPTNKQLYSGQALIHHLSEAMESLIFANEPSCWSFLHLIFPCSKIPVFLPLGFLPILRICWEKHLSQEQRQGVVDAAEQFYTGCWDSSMPTCPVSWILAACTGTSVTFGLQGCSSSSTNECTPVR